MFEGLGNLREIGRFKTGAVGFISTLEYPGARASRDWLARVSEGRRNYGTLGNDKARAAGSIRTLEESDLGVLPEASWPGCLRALDELRTRRLELWALLEHWKKRLMACQRVAGQSV